MQDQDDNDLGAASDEPDGSAARSGDLEHGETETAVAVAVKPGLPEGVNKERRLLLIAYEYWYSLLEGRGFPAISDMSRDNVETFRDNSFLVDFPTESDGAVLRFVGASIIAEYEGETELVGQSAATVPGESILSRLIVHFPEVLAHRAPVSFEAEYDSNRNSHILYRGILLPFSDDDQNIHFILGVLNWKEVALAAKAEKALEPPQPSQPPVAPDAAVEAPNLSAGAQGGLAAAVANGRAAASAVHHVDGRSRGTLYDVLAHVLNIYEEGVSDPAALKKLLLGAGIRSQARAPFTPIIKLLFGPGYDKTRITEYATALSYAHGLGVLSGDLGRFLRDHEGGIKGCVMLARATRRGSAGAASGAGTDPVEALRKAPVLGSISLPQGYADRPEFTILIGRRKGGARDGSGDKEKIIEIIAELKQKKLRIEPLLKQAVREIAHDIAPDDDAAGGPDESS